jgi:hypothetical protein
MLFGAVQIEIVIPHDATVFAFSFQESLPAIPTGARTGKANCHSSENRSFNLPRQARDKRTN